MSPAATGMVTAKAPAAMTSPDAVREPRAQPFALLVGPKPDTCRDSDDYQGFHAFTLLNIDIGTGADLGDAQTRLSVWSERAKQRKAALCPQRRLCPKVFLSRNTGVLAELREQTDPTGVALVPGSNLGIASLRLRVDIQLCGVYESGSAATDFQQ